MKVDLELENKKVEVSVSEDDIGFICVISGGGMHATAIRNIDLASALDACTSLLRRALSGMSPTVVAFYLGFLRHELMEEGALNENVDMAVSLNGRVLPLGNLIKKDR